MTGTKYIFVDRPFCRRGRRRAIVSSPPSPPSPPSSVRPRTCHCLPSPFGRARARRVWRERAGHYSAERAGAGVRGTLLKAPFSSSSPSSAAAKDLSAATKAKAPPTATRSGLSPPRVLGPTHSPLSPFLLP